MMIKKIQASDLEANENTQVVVLSSHIIRQLQMQSSCFLGSNVKTTVQVRHSCQSPSAPVPKSAQQPDSVGEIIQITVSPVKPQTRGGTKLSCEQFQSYFVILNLPLLPSYN